MPFEEKALHVLSYLDHQFLLDVYMYLRMQVGLLRKIFLPEEFVLPPPFGLARSLRAL